MAFPFKRLALGLVVAALVVILGFCGYCAWQLFGDSVKERFERRSFDSEVWKSAPRDFENPLRLRMVDDLLRRHDFIGLSSAEVKQILGEADETAFFSDWDLVYWLGPERGPFGIDSEWLVLKLDPEGKVSDFRIARD